MRTASLTLACQSALVTRTTDHPRPPQISKASTTEVYAKQACGDFSFKTVSHPFCKLPVCATISRVVRQGFLEKPPKPMDWMKRELKETQDTELDKQTKDSRTLSVKSDTKYQVILLSLFDEDGLLTEMRVPIIPNDA